MSAPSRVGVRLTLWDRGILVVLLGLATADVLAGPLRYYLYTTGVPWLVYLPKVLAIGAAGAGLLRVASTARASAAFLCGLLLFATYVIVGTYFTGRWYQAAFGAFSLSPLVFGVLAERPLRRVAHRAVAFASVLWCAVAAGVVLDAVATVPWAGLEYQLGGVDVEATREWTTFGLERVAGFARTSYQAAGQLLFLAGAIVALGRGRVGRWLLWLLTGGLIALTTTKSAVAVYLVVTLLLPLIEPKLVPPRAKRFVAVAVPGVATAIGLALPVSTLVVRYQLNLNSIASRLLFASFEDRLTRTWPDGFRLIAQHGSLILGRGIGGIGAAQAYFEPSLYTFGDNMYLYWYVTFGLIGVALLVAYAWYVCRLGLRGLPDSSQRWTRLAWLWAVTILLSGWANSSLGQFSDLLFGLTFTYAIRWRNVAPRSLDHDAPRTPGALPPHPSPKVVW